MAWAQSLVWGLRWHIKPPHAAAKKRRIFPAPPVKEDMLAEGTQPAKIRPQGGAGGGDKTELIVGVVSPVLVCSASWRSRGELCMLHPKGTRIIQFPVSGSGPWVPSRQPCSKAHQLAGQPPCGQPRAVAFSAVPPAPAARALTQTPPSCASLEDLPQGWCGQTTESESPLELKAGAPSQTC